MKHPGLALAAILAVAMTACAGGGARPPAARDPFARMLAQSRDLGPAPADAEMSVTLLLARPPGRSLGERLALAQQPGPMFGSYPAPDEVAALGPAPESVGRVRSRLAGFGLRVEWTPGSSVARASGRVAALDAALGTRIRDYLAPDGIRYRASAADPAVPPEVAGQVDAITRILTYRPRSTDAIPLKGLSPVDIGQAYDIARLRSLGVDGAGETVVIWGSNGHLQADLDAFTTRYSLPPIKVEVEGEAVDKAGGEETMDIEVVHAIAPGARIVIFRDDAGTLDQVGASAAAEARKHPGAIFSESWSICDLQYGRAITESFVRGYEEVVAAGVASFASTGDMGGYQCLRKSWGAAPGPEYIGAALPASAPGVTAVGGTRLSLRQDGSWYNEEVWESPAHTAGTGGNISGFIPMPAWQRGPGVVNQFNRDKRSIPDVSAVGDPATGLAIIVGGEDEKGGGTSQSAPLWAGIQALLNQYLRKQGLKPPGSLNPAFYAIAAGNPPLPAFHDIVIGTNLVYPATPGYDLASGLGTPDVFNLAKDVEAYLRNGGRI